MRLVFDTNVLARSYPGATGPARAALLRALRLEHQLIASDYLLRELERILQYPRILRRFVLTREQIRGYLDELARVSVIVVPAEVPLELMRDTADAPIIGTAIAGSADVLCTRDADFAEERVYAFCAQRGIRIMTDLELLSDPDFEV